MSPLLGSVVTVEGIVTARLIGEAGSQLGVFVQASRGDSNPRTSDAVFVVTDAELDRGMRVRASGTVTEMGSGRSTRTSIIATATAQCADGTLPPAESISLPIQGRHIEALESMRVSLDQPVTVSGLGSVGFRGELVVSAEAPLIQPTATAMPGEAAKRWSDQNRRQSLTLDDGSLRTNDPELPVRQLLATESPIRVGDRLHEVIGVMDHFAGYRLHLASRPRVQSASQRPASPPARRGDTRIAAVNLYNYFNGDGEGGAFPTARGAPNPQAFAYQHAKLMQMLVRLDAEIFALAELENDGYDELSAIATLTNGLNRQQDVRDYQYVALAGPLGGDDIAVGLIYDTRALVRVGAAETLENYPFDDFNRPPLAQTFQHIATEQTLTVVAVHLKSKGCGDQVDGANRDQRDGQGCWNAKRAEAALALTEWVEHVGAGPQRTAIVGDFNAYRMEQPITLLEQAGYRHAAIDGHTYNYRGAAGSLDHALLGSALHDTMTQAGAWSINAAEADWLSYRFTDSGRDPQPTPFRSSDHDPLIIDFQLLPN